MVFLSGDIILSETYDLAILNKTFYKSYTSDISIEEVSHGDHTRCTENYDKIIPTLL